MYVVKASGQISLQCENCKAQDLVGLDSLTFETQRPSDGVADGPETTCVASPGCKCPNCDELEMRLDISVTMADGMITDVNTHPFGCNALESDEEIRSMIRVEDVIEPVLPSSSCPLCGATMVERTAKRGASAGSVFWGCSRYPKCRGTR